MGCRFKTPKIGRFARTENHISGGMMKALKLTILLVVAFLMTACATVRKQDLDAWVGIPVEALDTHSVFLTMPVYKSTTSSGVEVRNYTNSEDVARFFSSAGGRNGGKHDHSVFTTCSTSRIVCNNIFYIKDGVVSEYAPTGNCYTDATVQPQTRFLRLRAQ